MTRDTPRAEPTIANDAPVVSAAELEIDAPIDSVWTVLTTVEKWPEWNPDVKAVSLAGPIAEGSTFCWNAGPGTITSVVEHVDPPNVLAWSGRTLGIRAVHVWHLSAQNGKTFVRTKESYDGLAARVLRRSLQKTLDAALAKGARYLKAEAERVAPTLETR